MKKNIATVSTSGDLKLLIIGPFVLEWIIENNKIKLKQQNIYIKLNLISFSFGMWNWLIKIAIEYNSRDINIEHYILDY